MPKPRPIRFDGDLAYVPLTKGYEAVIDAADAPLVANWCWCASVEKHTVYAMRKTRAGGQQKTIKMHRQIMRAGPTDEVDHRDRNGINNTRKNLRFLTRTHNLWNRAAARRNSMSGLIGATWNSARRMWVARIQSNGKNLWLGYFPTAESAHEAYMQAAKRMRGEFSAQ